MTTSNFPTTPVDLAVTQRWFFCNRRRSTPVLLLTRTLYQQHGFAMLNTPGSVATTPQRILDARGYLPVPKRCV